MAAGQRGDSAQAAGVEFIDENGGGPGVRLPPKASARKADEVSASDVERLIKSVAEIYLVPIWDYAIFFS